MENNIKEALSNLEFDNVTRGEIKFVEGLYADTYREKIKVLNIYGEQVVMELIVIAYANGQLHYITIKPDAKYQSMNLEFMKEVNKYNSGSSDIFISLEEKDDYSIMRFCKNIIYCSMDNIKDVLMDMISEVSNATFKRYEK